jgi:hypothetical protein
MASSHGYRVDPALGSCTDDTVRTAFSGCIQWMDWLGWEMGELIAHASMQCSMLYINIELNTHS